ncbi:hypothetical protein NE236_08005 [Actinoallomurus purpureus]|uniref:hypothetical protein n=1 Tax=Actinoallomurus purpureus TaxID=478114 RepID=UPI0020931271|nr:hypothetical protein [Actinoallomurus purpureus]MCO6004922.1 hypothetical protein [Actinoallomurus purpureus]
MANNQAVTVEDVQARWRAREAPDGDLILFGDGTLSVMEFHEFADPIRWEWSEVVRAKQWTPTNWLDVDITLASCTQDGIRALAGESAAHGSIGWVALIRLGEETLEWLAISQHSNPFSSVELNETTVSSGTSREMRPPR